MNLAKKLWMTTGESSGGGPAPSGRYVDDVFSTYVYKGNGANRSFVTGQNLLADGGMVWTKGRSGTYGVTDHYLFHTERGSDIFLSTNTTNGQGSFTAGTSVSSFNNDGFSLGTSLYVNNNTTEYVSWVFKNAPKFYGHRVVTKSAGSSVSVNFPELGELGMVRVKSISGAGSWYVWHRSLSAGQLLVGETVATAATLGHVTVSGTTVTLVNGVIADGTYLVEAFAHDSSADGIIQCGSFTPGNPTTGYATINLGWEPQFVLLKAAGVTEDWQIYDTMRGFNESAYGNVLRPTMANAEVAMFPVYLTNTGFEVKGISQAPYIYLAIRRQNRPPTIGTQVFDASTLTPAPNLTGTKITTAFATDLVVSTQRTHSGLFNTYFSDRLRGGTQALVSNLDNTESTLTPYNWKMDYNDGFVDNFAFPHGTVTTPMIYWNFRRAPGFFDVVCDTGARHIPSLLHSLGAAPQLVIRKARSAGTQWEVWHSALAATEKLVLNSNAAKATDTAAWNSTLPTATQFTVGTGTNVNANTTTFVTYLFATLPGISKVGSYSGNGGTQTIPCGFTTGSRFILIKRIDNTGDWFVWDTARGVTPTTDPHLSLNTAATEVTTDDSIDQDASGFVVNQNAATNINALGGNYLFLAIA